MKNRLTGGSRLARNSIFNLIGLGLPFLVAFFAIPRLIHGLGTDRFAVLTIAWLVLGYFGLFDLGLGRALTQVVSQAIGAGEHDKAPPIVWPALGMMAASGAIGGALLAALSPWMTHSALKVPVDLQPETLNSFYLLALCIPVVVFTSGLNGILAAFQRFDVLNVIRVPMGIYNFLAPLAVLPFSRSVASVVAVLVVGRTLAGVAHLVACRHILPPIRDRLKAQRGTLGPVVRLGAWMTVTNLIGPVLLNVDRFVIGTIVSVTAVAYYATPLEVVARVQLVPGAIVSVLFPAFAASYLPDHSHMVQLLTKGTKYIAILLFPAILILVAFSPQILQWWLGGEFAVKSTPVLQWLAIGTFAISIGNTFSTLVQGVGRPDLTAKLQLLELPVYVAILWWTVGHYGIVGAAVVWTLRATAEGIILLWISGRFLGEHAAVLTRMSGGLLLALSTLVIPLSIRAVIPRTAAVGLILLGFILITWFVALGDDERAMVKGRVRLVLARGQA